MIGSKPKALGESVTLNIDSSNSSGRSGWLLKQTRGATLFDNIILTFLKAMYLGVRIIIRIAIGKDRRDTLYADRRINFSDYLYRSIEVLGLDNSILLVFIASKYNFRFYSRITRKVENFLIDDMYASMSSHEDEVLQYFSPKPGDVVVDVGAGFGFYTLISSMRVESRGRIIAIEPQPDSFEMLYRNIKLNGLTNTTALNCAAYSYEAELKLYSSYSLIAERAGSNKQKFVHVKAKTLDGILSQIVQPTDVNWIKIDVEGAEFEVLKGASNILSKSKDIKLLIEIHGKENYEPITKFLSSFNFVIEYEKKYGTGDRHIILGKHLAPNIYSDVN